jgi:amino-acid N-acetyltransferase
MEKTVTVNNKVTIRKATPADLPTIEKLIARFVEDGTLLPRTFQELEELLDTFFIAEIEGQMMGCAALDIYNRKLAEIRSLAVASEAQGNGVGKLLVQACVDLAHERGIFEVMAISSSDAFFQACGFDFTLPNLRRAFFMQTRDEL